MDHLPLRHIGDHEDRSVSLLPLVHRRTGKTALVRAMSQVFQLLEDRVYSAYASRTFSLARGRWLDEWGALYGVARDGLDDLWYRRLILVAARARKSKTTVNEVIGLWKLACEPCVVDEFARYELQLISLTAYRDDSSWMPDNYAKRAAALVRDGCTIGSVVLLEQRRPFTRWADSTDWPPGGSDVPGDAFWARSH
jgi:hypothetical protein